MATTTGIKFYVKNLGASDASAFSTTNTGSIVFDKTAHAIFVNGTQYGGNVSNATYSNNVLTITKADGSSNISINFAELANAQSVQNALNAIGGELDNLESAIGNVDGSDGGWQGYSNTNYINNATSLSDADKKLDAAIKAVDTKVGNINGAVQSISLNNVLLSEDSDHDVTIATDGTYNASNNKIATESTVTTAIENLDTSADVQAVAYTAANTTNGAKLTFKGVSETDGVIAQGTGATELQFAKVATTGSYNDLSDTPNLANVATSGAAADVSYAGTDAVAGSEPATVEGALDDLYVKVAQAAAGGVLSIGGATGTVTVGNGLTSTSGAGGSISTKVNGYIVNNAGTNTDALDIDSTKVDSAYTTANTTNLATVATVTKALETLDVSDITGFGAGKTLATLTETDGKIAATFQDISITASQISDASTSLVTSVKGDGTYLEPNSATNGNVTVSHKTRTESTSTSNGTVGSSNTGTTGTFDVVTYTFDAAGHETAKDTKTITVTFPSAADLGLSGAMHFKGTESSLPNPTTSDSYENGDVILVGSKEYVRSGKTDSAAGSWVELGDESSYAMKSVTITGTGALGGGGSLEENRTITHNAITTPSSGTDTAKTQGQSVTAMTGITGDGYGHVTGYTTDTFTIPTVNDATLTLAGAASGPITVAGSKSGNAATFNANDATANTITITHSAAPTGLTPSAIKVAVDSYGHVQAGTAIVASEIGFTAPSGMIADDVQEAIEELNTNITSANLTIDGHKGTITTGNGITAVAADNGSFALDLDTTNANGLYLSGSTEGSKKLAMHVADESSASNANFGTVKVTNGNGLTISSGVVAYAHNTSAITVASKDTTSNVVTINGTLTPDASDAITTSNAITLAAVAATGSASDVTVTSGTYGGSTATTSLQQAVSNLDSAISTKTAVVDGTEEIVVNAANATTIATVGGATVSTKVNFYWEEYA